MAVHVCLEYTFFFYFCQLLAVLTTVNVYYKCHENKLIDCLYNGWRLYPVNSVYTNNVYHIVNAFVSGQSHFMATYFQ